MDRGLKELLQELYPRYSSVPAELMEKAGKLYPQLATTQNNFSERAANYLGRKPVYAVKGGFVKDMPPGVLGLQSYDHDGPFILYNPEIAKNPDMAHAITRHEAYHLNQGSEMAKKALLGLVVAIRDDSEQVYEWGFGRALIEGGVNVGLKEMGEKPLAAYPFETQFAEDFNRIYPLKNLYDAAEKGPNALLEVMNRPDIKKLIAKTAQQVISGYDIGRVNASRNYQVLGYHHDKDLASMLVETPENFAAYMK